jgi:hypothetical protein
MITPNDILRQLIRRLPYETVKFCEILPYTHLKIVSGNLTFKSVNEFKDKKIVSNGIKMINPCVQVTLNGMLTIILTKNNHKFSTPKDGNVVMVETDIGSFQLQGVLGANQISVIGDANGATVIKEQLKSSCSLMDVISNIDGVVTVKLGNEYSYNCDCEGALYSAIFKITTSPTISKMITHYASLPKNNDKLWLYIIAGDRRTISKPTSDAGTIFDGMSYQHEELKVTTEFDLYVWFPTHTSNENAREQINEAYNVLYNALNRCLFGQISDETGKGGYQCVPHSSGTSEAESIPNYVHHYKYLCLEVISYACDGQNQDVDYYNEPLTNLDMRLLIKSGDEEPQSMNIKFDDLRGE